MTYNEDQLRNLHNEFAKLTSRQIDLISKLKALALSNPDARELTQHGLMRRILILGRCVENVFTAIPPEQRQPPPVDKLKDAQINLQAFVFNVFGVLDNLAGIWVSECEIRGKRGNPLSPMQIGLGVKCDIVRASLPEKLLLFLTEIQAWIDFVEDYRHALGHRIPLYIPPSSVKVSDADKYRANESKIFAAQRDGRLEEAEQLQRQNTELEFFQGLATHSFREGASPFYFHSQMLADFATIEKLAGHFIAALQERSAR